MPVSVGQIIEGTVTGITNFGAFIQLPGGKNGLVHISEISHDYVDKVGDYLKRNEKVRVKVLSVTGDGKISLSIRQAKPKTTRPAEIDWSTTEDQQKNLSFEDKLNLFLRDSSDKMDQLKSREPKRSGIKPRREM